MNDSYSPLTIRFYTSEIIDGSGRHYEHSADDVRALLSVFNSTKGRAFLKRRNGVVSDVETTSKTSRFEWGFNDPVTVNRTRKEIVFDGNYDKDGVDVELKRLVGDGMNEWFSERQPYSGPFKCGDKFYSDEIPGIEFDGAAPYLVLKARLELDNYERFLNEVEDDYNNRRNNLAQSIEWALSYQFDATNMGRQPVHRSKTTVFEYYPPLLTRLNALNARALELVRKIHEVDDSFSIPFKVIEERLINAQEFNTRWN